LDLCNQFDHLFWFGDLNYRIDLTRDEVAELIADKNWPGLLSKDQLKREIKLRKSFVDFSEEAIVFKPTYKYAVGSRTEYSEEKPVRIPAWCDRVIWRSAPGLKPIHESYGCCDEITTSDHHPVFATFRIPVRFPNRPHERIAGCRIVIRNLKISQLRFAKNDGNVSPFVLFIGPFIESSQKTPVKDKTRNPDWTGTQIELIPIISARNSLTSQILRVLVGDKGKIVTEKHKVQRWAQSAISLQELSRTPVSFESSLSSFGYADCGTLSGEMFIDFLNEDGKPQIDFDPEN
jgi:hypothetical protein